MPLSVTQGPSYNVSVGSGSGNQGTSRNTRKKTNIGGLLSGGAPSRQPANSASSRRLGVGTISAKQLNTTGQTVKTFSSGNRSLSTPSSQVNDSISRLTAEIAALTAAQNSFVAAPSFDFQGNLARARTNAKSTISPTYVDKLELFINGQKAKRDQKESEAELARESLELDFNQSIDNIDRSRTRTNEDSSFNLAEIDRNEDQFQTLEGRQFDDQRLEQIASVVSGGGGGSGVDRRLLSAQIENRNLESEAQVRQFTNEKRVEELGRTRTLEDLAASEEITQLSRELGDRGINLSLDSFVENQGIEERYERFSLQLEESQAIRQETQAFEQKGQQDFVASLRAQGRNREAERFAELYL